MPWATLGVVLLVLLIAAAPAAWQEAMALQRDAWPARPWQLWTAHLVHYGGPHALFDALGLLLCGAAVERLGGTRAWLVGWGLATPLLALGVVAAEPGLAQYRGASGAVVMLAVAAGGLLWRDGRVGRAWLCAAGVALVLKLAWDGLADTAASAVLPAGVRVAWSAHAAGLLLGLAWGRVQPLRRPGRST